MALPASGVPQLVAVPSALMPYCTLLPRCLLPPKTAFRNAFCTMFLHQMPLLPNGGPRVAPTRVDNLRGGFAERGRQRMCNVWDTRTALPRARLVSIAAEVVADFWARLAS